MSDRDHTPETGVSGPIVPALTPEEKRVFGQLYAAADSENMGVVTGELAVKFFEKSGLNPRILGEIWGIADVENRGLLDKVGFSVALRLIGRAQNGEHPRKEMAMHPGPLPRFEGVNVVYPQPTGPQSPAPIQGQSTGPGGFIKVPQLLPQDVEKFTALFEKSGAADGILPGEVAKGIFLRSKLPTETLTQIWRLADRQGRGALGVAEFVVAMHLITSCKNGSLPALPQILPPGLYDVAAGRPPTRGNGPGDRRPGGRGGPMMPPIPPIPKQFSGQGPRAQSPLSRQFTPPGPQNFIPRTLTGDWAINPTDKQKFDQVFLTVDKQNRNFITGEEAVPFFSTSNLPEEVLAQIWDLADINKAGRLSRDEFAIAMYLIRQQRTNPGTPLPEVLPPNLIPPSMRQPRPMTGQATGPSAVPPPNAFDAPPPAPPAPPKSAAEDLFGLDNFSSAPPQPTSAAPAPVGGQFGSNDMFGAPKPASPMGTGGPNSPMQTGGPAPGGPGPFGQQPPFQPSPGFRQPGLSPAPTGGSFGAPQGYQPQSPFQPQPLPQPKNDMDDLLGDADPEVSKKLTNESAELANLSNQIGSLTTQTQELKSKRASTEQDLSNLTTQKQHIESQLSQLRSAYEREAEVVRQVEVQLASSRAETTKLRNDYNIAEAEYHQLQAKKQEVTAGLEADRRENENLKQHMNVITAENAKLRQELERLQSQARHQKGMVSISKKQVSTSEAEREKLKGEIEEAKSAAASPAPAAPASPTLSQGSVNTNPFYRKSPAVPEGGSFSPGTFSPGAQSAPSNMDDVFGPAITSPVSQASAPTSTPFFGQPHPPARAATDVNPSASVAASRPETPTNWQGSVQATDSPAREHVFPRPEDRRSSFSVKSDAGTEASGAFPSIERDRSPFAPAQVERNTTGTTSGGDAENRSLKEKRDSFSGFGNSGIPGSFPTAGTPNPIKQTPTGESNMSNRSRTSNLSKPPTTFGDQPRADPFSLGKDEGRGPAASKQDFDEAFRSFGFAGQKAVEHHTGGSGSISNSKFDTEFPPIEEIHHDDSDSESDAGGAARGGFSGGFDDNFTTSSPVQKQATPGVPSMQTPHTEQPSNPPPPANAQQSPPPYGAPGSASSEQGNSAFPPEFSTLLPSRSDPMEHNAPTPGGGTNDVYFPSTAGAPAPKPAAPSAPKDEFDDEFGDLAEAKEAGDVDEVPEFSASSGAAAAAFDDFNPVFDNPSMSGAAPAGKQDDFAGFSFNIGSEGAPSGEGHGESPVMQQPKTSSEDWDAIFAGLDNTKTPQPAKELGAGTVPVNGGAEHSGKEKDETGGVSLGEPGAGEGPTTSPEGAAMDDNDKINNLMGMGFDREKSVKALEGNGWNVERAANALISDA